MKKRGVSKFFIIMFIMILISSTFVAAGFLDWFFGNGLGEVTGKVINCITNDDCPVGYLCFESQCINPNNQEATICTLDSDCSALKPNCISGVCAICETNEQCEEGEYCHILSGKCLEEEQVMQQVGMVGVVNQNQPLEDLEQVYEDRELNPFDDNQEQPSVEASTDLEILVSELNTLISSMETALNDNAKKPEGIACANDGECQSDNCVGIFWKRCA